MEVIRKCKNKNCQKNLPEGYKHKHCENCRNQHVKNFKNIGKTALGAVVFIGGTIVTKGKIKPKL